jgi:hypothetical protein
VEVVEKLLGSGDAVVMVGLCGDLMRRRGLEMVVGGEWGARGSAGNLGRHSLLGGLASFELPTLLHPSFISTCTYFSSSMLLYVSLKYREMIHRYIRGRLVTYRNLSDYNEKVRSYLSTSLHQPNAALCIHSNAIITGAPYMHHFIPASGNKT